MCKYSALRGSLHPSQTLVNIFREPQGNFLDVRTYLSDRTRPYFVLLSDLAKAFERVNPHWVLCILQILNAPVWVLQFWPHGTCGLSSAILCRQDSIYVVLNAIPGVLLAVQMGGGSRQH